MGTKEISSIGGRRPLQYILIAVTLLFIFFLSFLKITDYDIWYHLKTGEYIVRNLFIPRTDIFSYTAFGHRWVTHEWLSEVVFYLFVAAAGVDNLVFLKSALITATFGVYLVFLRERISVHVLAPVVAIAAVLARGRFLDRPELLTYLFAAIYITILEAFRTDARPGSPSRRYLWALPVLMVLWANSHGGAIFGVVIVGAYAFGEAAVPLISRVSGRFKPLELHRADEAKKIKTIIVIAFVTFLAGFINPNTYDVYYYPFFIMDLMKKVGIQVLEFTRPDWGVNRLYFIFFGVSALILLLNIRRAAIAHILLFILFSFSAFRFRRNIALWAIISAPFIACYIEAAKNDILGRLRKMPLRGGSPGGAVPALLAVSFIALLAYSFIGSDMRAGSWGRGVKDKIFPEKAIRFIESNGVGGNMFNTYEFGGYLIWRTYPERKVYLDGRADVYPELLMDEAELARRGFVNLAEKYGINYAIIDYKEGNEEYMSTDPFFRNMLALVWWDDVAMVYLKRTPENYPVIEKYEYRYVRPMDTVFRSVNRADADKLVAELRRNIVENPDGVRNRLLLKRACSTIARCD